MNKNRNRKRNVPADDEQCEGPGDHGGVHGVGQDIQDKDDAANGDYLNLWKVSGRDHNQNRINIMPYIAEVERSLLVT